MAHDAPLPAVRGSDRPTGLRRGAGHRVWGLRPGDGDSVRPRDPAARHLARLGRSAPDLAARADAGGGPARARPPLPSARLQWPSDFPAAPVPAGAGQRRPASAGALLLGVGAFLLVAAGIAFLAFTWDLLGPFGQITVLLALGAGCLAATARLAARLRGTATALGVVGALLVVIAALGTRTLGPDLIGETASMLLGSPDRRRTLRSRRVAAPPGRGGGRAGRHRGLADDDRDRGDCPGRRRGADRRSVVVVGRPRLARWAASCWS